MPEKFSPTRKVPNHRQGYDPESRGRLASPRLSWNTDSRKTRCGSAFREEAKHRSLLPHVKIDSKDSARAPLEQRHHRGRPRLSNPDLPTFWPACSSPKEMRSLEKSHPTPEWQKRQTFEILFDKGEKPFQREGEETKAVRRGSPPKVGRRQGRETSQSAGSEWGGSGMGWHKQRRCKLTASFQRDEASRER